VFQEFEIETENDAITRFAFGFAGGIGNTGTVVGAVIGIGIKLGRADTMEESLHALGVLQGFRRRFEAEMATINCRELTEAGLSALPRHPSWMPLMIQDEARRCSARCHAARFPKACFQTGSLDRRARQCSAPCLNTDPDSPAGTFLLEGNRGDRTARGTYRAPSGSPAGTDLV
jgi:hypothetical protein